MTEPFPLLFQALSQSTATPEPDRPADFKLSGRGAVMPMFEASVKGVQSRFGHLSQADIASPPHQWFDAALARQIALHLLVEHFAVPKRAVAEELERSREAVNRALRTIDDRLQHPDFHDAYEAMAQSAQAALENGGSTDEQY